jgi:hypothetical protein
MSMPGFTAEAALYNANVHYQAVAKSSFYSGFVQPALSDVFYPRPIFCLKYQCKNIAPAGFPPHLACWRVLGFWNPVTHSCE